MQAREFVYLLQKDCVPWSHNFFLRDGLVDPGSIPDMVRIWDPPSLLSNVRVYGGGDFSRGKAAGA
jgi:hypothetical protein